MVELPEWARRIAAGDVVECWCAVCGLPGSHRVHDRAAKRGDAVDVSDALERELLGVVTLPAHFAIEDEEGETDGRESQPGELRMPGWVQMPALFEVPLREGYVRCPAALAAAFVWRAPRSHRWRWGCRSAEVVRVSSLSERWLNDALKGARKQYPEAFP